MSRGAKLAIGLVLIVAGLGLAAKEGADLLSGRVHRDDRPGVLVLIAIGAGLVCGGGALMAYSLARTTPAAPKPRQARAAMLGLGAALGAAALPIVAYGPPRPDMGGGLYVLYCMVVVPAAFLLAFGAALLHCNPPDRPRRRRTAPTDGAEADDGLR